MALAVTHVLLTIIILDLFRHYVFDKRKFPRYLVVIGGIAGLAPDLDIPLSWVVNLFTDVSVNLHRVFTHSLVFVLLFLIIGLTLHFRKNFKWAKIFYVITFGWFSHLLLDCLFGGLTTSLWPLSFVTSFCPEWSFLNHAESIDAIILVLWLVHEEIHKKIKDYI